MSCFNENYGLTVAGGNQRYEQQKEPRRVFMKEHLMVALREWPKNPAGSSFSDYI